MLHQGVNVALLKLDTVVEHGDGRVGKEEESEAVAEDGQDCDSSEMEDVIESEKEEEDKHESEKKAPQNEKQKDK